MKLIKIAQLKGQIELITGLHIGAGDTEMHIGGTDSPVVKHPQTLQPYIPGSSLKGKIRSLLELYSGLIADTNGKPVSWSTYQNRTMPEDLKSKALEILLLFGGGAQNDTDFEFKDADGRPVYPITRLSFSDCFLSEESRNGIISEVKSENSIDRSKGTASNPRFIERVPQGIKFDFALSVKIFENDEKYKLMEFLKKGLCLLELDALGGSGSRGYGRIRFSNLKLDGETFKLPENPFAENGQK